MNQRGAILAFMALASVLSVPVQGTAPQVDMPPAWKAAGAGVEPYCSLLEQGLPLLRTATEVAALPPEQRVAQASAMKKVLLIQKTRARDERNRLTPGNYAACAALAEKLGAPAEFVAYQRLLAGGELSPRASYTVQEALRHLCWLYLVDVSALHYYVLGSRLAAGELIASAEWLPMEGLFNMIPAEALTADAVERDFVALLDIMPALTDLYRGINSRESAEAALPALLPMLVQFESTVGGRKYAEPELTEAALQRYGARLQPLYAAFAQERRRLQEANYHDCIRLRVADMLIN